MNKYIIFDLDNTLIDTNPIYRNASNQFADYMTVFGFDKKSVLKRQDEIDVELFKQYGYSINRFADSFVETAKELIPHAWTAKHPMSNQYVDILSDCKKIGMSVFNTEAKEFEYTNNVVKTLFNRGYKLGLITAGEFEVQNKRFSRLSIRNLFNDVWVVPDKNKEVFDDFAYKVSADKKTSWMIGDSIRSDIKPSLESGFNAIHINSENWHSIELRKTNENIITVNKLSDILGIIP